jgi:hypothetical protein
LQLGHGVQERLRRALKMAPERFDTPVGIPREQCVEESAVLGLEVTPTRRTERL